MRISHLLLAAILFVVSQNCFCEEPVKPAETKDTAVTDATGKPLPKTEEEWKKVLTPEQFYILRQKGTERAFTGKYFDTKTPGVYRCAGCGEVLFTSKDKFDSHCGWPSFSAAAAESKITQTKDTSHGMERIEVTCKKCGAHLGHIFDDGPKPTGKRYCINSVSISLEADKDGKKESEKAAEKK